MLREEIILQCNHQEDDCVPRHEARGAVAPNHFASNELRNDIIGEARSWIGTRFHHQGRCKKTSTHKGGVDCIGLIVGVAQSVGFDVKDETDYSRQPQGSRLTDAMHLYLHSIPLSEVRAGDVLLFTFEKDPQHVGIVSELSGGELGLIHTYRDARGVVEHRLDEHWWKKAVAAFAFPEKDNL